MVHGLSEELKQTRIRVTAVYPGDFEDLSPLSEAWDAVRENLTNREVVDSILFTLDLPRNARVRALVVE